MDRDWKKLDEEAERFRDQQHQESLKKANSARRNWLKGCDDARRWAKTDDLFPERDEYGELRYTAQQGLRAACHAREDITAVLLLQEKILERLDRNHSLLFGPTMIALLAYIAYRVS